MILRVLCAPRPPRYQAILGYVVKSPSVYGDHNLIEKVFGMGLPPWRQPRGKWTVSLVNSHTNVTSKRWHLWKIDLRFAANSHPARRPQPRREFLRHGPLQGPYNPPLLSDYAPPYTPSVSSDYASAPLFPGRFPMNVRSPHPSLGPAQPQAMCGCIDNGRFNSN